MYKSFPYKISKQSGFLSVYLFALLFMALYGRLGFQILNQIILWGFGPILAFYVLEPKLGILHKTPKEYFFYLSMLLFAYLGYLNIEDTLRFYRYIQVFIANFVLMIIVYYAINNVKEWELVWKIVGLVGLIVALIGYFVEVPAIETDEYFRLTGITGNANGTANYARVSIVAALILLQLTEKKIMKIFIWASIIFLAYTILLTASRGNFGILVFILGGYVAFNYFKGWRIILLLLLLFFFGNLIVYLGETFLSNYYLFDRLTRNDSVSAALDDEARLQLYLVAWNQFLEHPLLGVGLNQFRFYAEGKISHTDILDILVQLGIFAGFIYCSIYVILFNKIIKLKKFFTSQKDVRVYQILLLCFSSELFFGLSNPNWFTQLQMVVLSLMIVYATKIRNTSEVFIKQAGPR